MEKINIDLTRLTAEDAKAQNITACNFTEELTQAEKLARDILAPLAVDALFIDEGNYKQASAANFGKMGELFADGSAVCGGAVWYCGGSAADAERLTLADGFRPRAFGRCIGGACFALILEDANETERAYLVRFEW